MSDDFTLIETIRGSTEYICERLDALTQTTAAAALLAHAVPGSDDYQNALTVLQIQLR